MSKPKIVGKSSGWKGPVTEFTCNQGSVGRKRIVFVGASYKFVHRVVRDMILVKGFENVDLVLLDVDRVPLRIVGDFVERVVRQQKTRMRVFRTLDRRVALKGADVVILSITTGGRESDFRSFEVCARYGIPVGVGDTLGPTALARNLRTVPVVMQLIRDMEELCPNAVMLNFTNPMSVLTGVMARHASFPVWGLCHSADGQFEYFAEIFGARKSEVAFEMGGVNHQSFITRLRVKGRDRMGDLLKASQRSAATVADSLMGTADDPRLQQEVFRLLGVWPTCGAGHLAEFYRHFFSPRRIEALGLAHEMKHLIPGREPFLRTPCPKIIKEWAYGPAPVGDLHLMTSEHAHELMWSFLTGEPCTRSLNILNTGGIVAGVDPQACVEVMATVAGRQVTARPVTLPRAALTFVQQWTAIHELSIQAALNCDRDAARQALFLDPHVGDALDIAPLLEDMLQATEPWLPKRWFHA